jgi:multiple sugar transport system substrate-binding protein
MRRFGILINVAASLAIVLSLSLFLGSRATAATPRATAHATLHASGPLTILIASSGDPETNAVKSEVAAWSKKTKIKATVINASNEDQQLAQGFASGHPPDAFYMTNGDVATYAKAGDLAPLDKLTNINSFYKSLRKAYTINGHLYAAPKDFSTLALEINNADWKAAHLTSKDYPKTWAQLQSDAKKLTKGNVVGLESGPQFERLGVFMIEAGGWLTSSNGKKATVNSAANIKALNFVKTMLKGGYFKFSSDLGAGWGGEAFGKGEGAMTIEGNWISGAMTTDYPNIKYTVVPLPAGPHGKGTMQYDGGWSIAKASPNIKATMNLIEYLTSPAVEMKNAKAFGVMPSVSSVSKQWQKQFKSDAAFLASAKFSKGIPPIPNISTVVNDFDSQLQTLSSSDPKTILDRVQQDLQGILSS